MTATLTLQVERGTPPERLVCVLMKNGVGIKSGKVERVPKG